MSPLWEWKQQLFAETTSADTSAVVVPLSTLKAVVYGEVAITTQSCHFSELSICCYPGLAYKLYVCWNVWLLRIFKKVEPFLSTCHQSKDNSS
ncbi:unnamed protein product [Brassica napus]|uniref:(rape) hypothetical protein n=1 Tax=Brassica napus TaxID=3708 RepID=A0A816PXZ9_BRANA|nr:unnamed protein product [Brassica napus]